MKKKRQSKKKEPNRGMALIAALVFFIVVLICFVDQIKNAPIDITGSYVIITAVMGLYLVAIIILICFILAKIRRK